MKRILIVDSDLPVRTQIGKYARMEGYEVTETDSGEGAAELCRKDSFDLVVLAGPLPGMDGFAACQTLRGFSQVPILMLSPQCGEADRIRGLELGADDYMAKPVSLRELMLRVAAILRRAGGGEAMLPQVIHAQGISIDLTARRVTVDGAPVTLTPKEFDLLALLVRSPDVAFSRKQLLDAIWGGEFSADTRTLDTHIKQIRHAIAPYNDCIVTLRGVGYRFEKKD